MTLVGGARSRGGSKPTLPVPICMTKAMERPCSARAVRHTIAGLRDVLGNFGDLSARMIRCSCTARSRAGPRFRAIIAEACLAAPTCMGDYGMEGEVQVSGANAMGNIQLFICRVDGDANELAPLNPPVSADEGWPNNSVVRKVAHVYALIGQDVRSGMR